MLATYRVVTKEPGCDNAPPSLCPAGALNRNLTTCHTPQRLQALKHPIKQVHVQAGARRPGALALPP
jgi:hypothetical protein